MYKLILALALGATMLPTHTFALGLGEIKVNSTLNQNLDARINLISAAPEDAEVLIVGLASREEFTKAGIDRLHSLTALKFKTIVDKKNVYISVTSAKPIRDPSINFLIEIDWSATMISFFVLSMKQLRFHLYFEQLLRFYPY